MRSAHTHTPSLEEERGRRRDDEWRKHSSHDAARCAGSHRRTLVRLELGGYRVPDITVQPKYEVIHTLLYCEKRRQSRHRSIYNIRFGGTETPVLWTYVRHPSVQSPV